MDVDNTVNADQHPTARGTWKIGRFALKSRDFADGHRQARAAPQTVFTLAAYARKAVAVIFRPADLLEEWSM
jgi:hypothetical protein